MYKTTTAILILLLVLALLYETQCKKENVCPPSPVRTAVVDTQKIINDYTSTWTKPKPDTIIKWKQKLVSGQAPDPVFVETERKVYITQPVDTAAILEDYFATRVYQDSTKLRNGKVYITDSVSKNQIIARKWDVRDTSAIPVYKQPRQVYFGGGAYFNLNKFDTVLVPGVHLDIGYINRKGQHLKVDVMRTTKNWQGGLSFYHTIRLRKRH